MEIGLESINIRNIRVEKIEFLIGKHPQYLTECHLHFAFAFKFPTKNSEFFRFKF